MLDGSDAVADWPVLNALVNTAGGASWVSLHHGGGVGMGYSIHSGMVIVADGTPQAAARLSRVLRNDPGMGVIRHADAGYDIAKKVAIEKGLDLSAKIKVIGKRLKRLFLLDSINCLYEQAADLALHNKNGLRVMFYNNHQGPKKSMFQHWRGPRIHRVVWLPWEHRCLLWIPPPKKYCSF
jgi:hypothetical protein